MNMSLITQLNLVGEINAKNYDYAPQNHEFLKFYYQYSRCIYNYPYLDTKTYAIWAGTIALIFFAHI